MYKNATSDHIFKGSWITSGELAVLQPANVFHRQLDNTFVPGNHVRNRHVLFRKSFELESVPEKALLFFSADDYAKIYINGVPAAQGPTPGYVFHYFYHSADITALLKPGRNTIAIHSYYQGLINRVWLSGDNRHGAICDITDGNGNVLLASDESFLCHNHTGFTDAGICGYQTQFLQNFNAAAAEYDFMREDFDDSKWGNARKVPAAGDYQLYPSPLPLLDLETVTPQEVCIRGKDVFIDFGAIFVGYLSFKATGKCGDTIELRFAQELNDDNSLRYNLRANCRYVEYFTLSGREGDQLSEYDYKSYRYVQLILPEGTVIDPQSITLTARHMPFELKAACRYQDETSRKIWDLCVRSLHYGVQEQIQDCMEREKGYYLGDGCYTMLTLCLLTGNFAPMRKLIDDFLRTSFINDGLMTCSHCSFMQEIAEYPFMMFLLLPVLRKLDNADDFVRERLPQFLRILEFYRENYARQDGLLVNLDKWCVVEWPNNMRDGYDADVTEGKVCTDMHIAINAWYLGAIRWYNRAAEQLGEKTFSGEKELTESFLKTFYLADKKLFCDREGSTHTSLPGNVYPWFAGLAPDAGCEQAIIQMVREKRLAAGMLFVSFPLFACLQKCGEEELMHGLITDKDTWCRMLREGATTTFEAWGKDVKWNTSLFHLTLSLAAAFMVDDCCIGKLLID